ncbi:acyltransferase family protein [Streptococcus sp. DD13]|uniref:acyltransferase family protein n=1 Tax=Streptococcus sp. DD13 TaxID=1777881 RepID=UPI000795E589|nr:acyltransferase family protein [Streptococcus sp. DD13]KXT78264.1 Acyltransferase family [Streptococcus sp. DD13]
MRIKWFSIIRVTGLLLVLLYHFFINPFKGGFVGVDVFFTFSGFLITALLIDEFHRNQSINLLAFYKRRFYRIVPPLVLMILVTLPLTLLVRNDFRASIGSQITAALGFMTNFFEIFSGTSYENQFTPHLFVHTWSLAIEVHYYILWALLVWGLTKLVRTVGQLRGIVFLSSLLLFIVSYLSMALSSFFVGGNFSSIYYSSFTHIFPFFIGSLLATLTGVQSTTGLIKKLTKQWDLRKTVSVLAGATFLLAIFSLLLPFDSIWTYLFGFLLASLSTAAMILASRVLHEKTPKEREEPKVLTFFSDISYSLYLFHWPFFILFKELFGVWIAVCLTLLFGTLFSALSFYVFEPMIAGKPVHVFGWNPSSKRSRISILTGFGTLAFFGLLITIFAPRLGNFEQQMMVDNLNQSNSRMSLTRSAAENSRATDYNIKEGTVIIGDSVTVRAEEYIKSALPTAQINGAVSRNLTEASSLLKLYNDSKSLPVDVVIALGTNPTQNYQALLDELVTNLPKGHRLIFVTPYDGNYSNQNESIAYQTGLYEKQLAGQYDYIVIADWWKAATENPAFWTNSDHIHFNLESNAGQVYAQTISNALKEAQNKPVKQK